jgi:hypothetical protein
MPIMSFIPMSSKRDISRKIKIIYTDYLIIRSPINFRFGDFADRIYPDGFWIKDLTYIARYASWIEIHLDTDSEDQLGTKYYDKRDAVSIYHLSTGLWQR